MSVEGPTVPLCWEQGQMEASRRHRAQESEVVENDLCKTGWTSTYTADGRNPASPFIHMSVLYYRNSYSFCIWGIYRVMQDFYRPQ